MNYFFKHIAENKARFCVALVGVLIVVSWHLVVLSLKSPHWQKIAMELGSIPQFDQQLHF